MTPIFQRYRCHKVVQAVKIRSFGINPHTGAARLIYGDLNAASIAVDARFVQKHLITATGPYEVLAAPFYYVVYEPDGYASISPVEVFEAGYTIEPADSVPSTGQTLGEPADPRPDLLDPFAQAALVALGTFPSSWDVRAKEAYVLAEAMLAERDRRRKTR